MVTTTDTLLAPTAFLNAAAHAGPAQKLLARDGWCGRDRGSRGASALAAAAVGLSGGPPGPRTATVVVEVSLELIELHPFAASEMLFSRESRR
jgi:hypothetical protein